jgi:putative nucleotidyltransferase with HDIG domain
MKRSIRLRGMNGPLKGHTWEAAELLRIGRLEALEIVLDDSSVSRYHAEVRATDRGWRVRDLGSTNGTRLNGVRLGNGQWPLRVKDLLQFGEVTVVVETIQDGEPAAVLGAGELHGDFRDAMRVAGASKASWSEALEGLAFDSNRCPRAGEQLLALLRAGHHLVHLEKEEDLLQSILNDAVGVLDAQRGAIVLARPNAVGDTSNQLEIRAITNGRVEPRAELRSLSVPMLPEARSSSRSLRAPLHPSSSSLRPPPVATGPSAEGVGSSLPSSPLGVARSAAVCSVPSPPAAPLEAAPLGAVATGRFAEGGGRKEGGRFHFSQSLATRCFSRGESILCHRVDEDPELAMARSIAEGAMGSVLCVLLRTPRKRLGVLHLDRSPWQKPFTLDDLHLADALAANVSAGIECCQLLRKQRDLFLDTITILAQAVELRDEYTGGHTYRVTTYSILLAEQLKLDPADVDLIRIGTPLHDIGKIGIDDAILRKPEKLTPQELEIMKSHTVMGDEIIKTIPDLHSVRPIVRSHHERWDGKGYPDGLAGQAISPLARVVALADAFDAMTSDRPYRKGMPAALAFAEIEKQAGRQFDPVFAAGFRQIKETILQEMEAQTSSPGPTRRMRAEAL